MYIYIYEISYIHIYSFEKKIHNTYIGPSNDIPTVWVHHITFLVLYVLTLINKYI